MAAIRVRRRAERGAEREGADPDADRGAGVDPGLGGTLGEEHHRYDSRGGNSNPPPGVLDTIADDHADPPNVNNAGNESQQMPVRSLTAWDWFRKGKRREGPIIATTGERHARGGPRRFYPSAE